MEKEFKRPGNKPTNEEMRKALYNELSQEKENMPRAKNSNYYTRRLKTIVDTEIVSSDTSGYTVHKRHSERIIEYKTNNQNTVSRTTTASSSSLGRPSARQPLGDIVNQDLIDFDETCIAASESKKSTLPRKTYSTAETKPKTNSLSRSANTTYLKSNTSKTATKIPSTFNSTRHYRYHSNLNTGNSQNKAQNASPRYQIITRSQTRHSYNANKGIEYPKSKLLLQEPLTIPPKNDISRTVNMCRGSPSFSQHCSSMFEILQKDAFFKAIPKTENIWNISFNSSDILPQDVIHDGIPTLKKKCLNRSLSRTSGYKGVVNLDPIANKVPPSIIYTDYMIDVINNLLEKNNKLIKNFKPLKDIEIIHRAAIVNWITKVHEHFGSDASVLFLCIRLFDQILIEGNMPIEKYQVTAMITYWIANKYSDIVECLTSNQLSQTANNVYSKIYLIHYERFILEYLNFNVSIEEPMIYVRYYLYILQVLESNFLSFSANYILDCLALKWEINKIPVSMQASGAVFTSLKLFNVDLDTWQKLEEFPGFYSYNDLFEITEQILEQLILMDTESFEFREPFYKYSSGKYDSVSVRVSKALKEL